MSLNRLPTSIPNGVPSPTEPLWLQSQGRDLKLQSPSNTPADSMIDVASEWVRKYPLKSLSLGLLLGASVAMVLRRLR